MNKPKFIYIATVKALDVEKSVSALSVRELSARTGITTYSILRLLHKDRSRCNLAKTVTIVKSPISSLGAREEKS
jgi:hypothetical protein